MADWRQVLEARREARMRRRQQQANRQAEAPAQPVQTRGGFGISVGGRPQANGPSIGDVAQKYGPKAARAGKILYDMAQSPTFNRGGSEGAFQSQRAGERADFSGAMPVPSNFDFSQMVGTPSTYGGSIAAEGGAEGLRGLGQMTPGANVGAMDVGGMGVNAMPAESGAGAGVGAGAGSALASGAGSLTSLGVGMLPGLIGGFAGADPATMAALNIVGTAAAPAAGGAVAGTMAGTGAAAGASAGLAAAAPAAMVVGPYLVAKLIQGIQAGADKKNLFQLQKRIQSIYTQLPGELNTLKGIPALTAQLTNASSPEEAANILKQLNTIQQNFQDNGWESHLKSGATTVKTVGDEREGAGGTADLPSVQHALDAYTKAFFPTMDIARMRAMDKLERAGYSPERIAQETGRYVGPQEWAGNMGSTANYFDPESGSQAFRKDFNPYLTEHFQKPGLAQDAANRAASMPNALQGASGEGGGWQSANIDTLLPQPTGGVWDEEALEAFKSIQPGHTEEGLAKLFGGEFAGGFQDQGIGGGLTGALPGSEVGGAGKRSPAFIVPEIENRAEAAAGARKAGQAPNQTPPPPPFGQAGRRSGPFGMRENTRGGFSVGSRGGAAGSRPFGTAGGPPRSGTLQPGSDSRRGQQGGGTF